MARTLTIATLKVNGFTYSAEGILDELNNWVFFRTDDSGLLKLSRWEREENFSHEEMEEALWDTALADLQRTARVDTYENEIEEV